MEVEAVGTRKKCYETTQLFPNMWQKTRGAFDLLSNLKVLTNAYQVCAPWDFFMCGSKKQNWQD